MNLQFDIETRTRSRMIRVLVEQALKQRATTSTSKLKAIASLRDAPRWRSLSAGLTLAAGIAWSHKSVQKY
ncbi:MAG: hypothetical protein EA343_11025 [Nodularia sp. (in: Bacteria)]|nr:MAG: hypothetical protein EA343_11025 [Nodularia sp. (in: cyanobacteria)]